MPFKALQSNGISIDDFKGFFRLSVLSTYHSHMHVTLTTPLGMGILSITSHHLIRTGHPIIIRGRKHTRMTTGINYQ